MKVTAAPPQRPDSHVIKIGQQAPHEGRQSQGGRQRAEKAGSTKWFSGESATAFAREVLIILFIALAMGVALMGLLHLMQSTIGQGGDPDPDGTFTDGQKFGAAAKDFPNLHSLQVRDLVSLAKNASAANGSTTRPPFTFAPIPGFPPFQLPPAPPWSFAPALIPTIYNGSTTRAPFNFPPLVEPPVPAPVTTSAPARTVAPAPAPTSRPSYGPIPNSLTRAPFGITLPPFPFTIGTWPPLSAHPTYQYAPTAVPMVYRPPTGPPTTLVPTGFIPDTRVPSTAQPTLVRVRPNASNSGGSNRNHNGYWGIAALVIPVAGVGYLIYQRVRSQPEAGHAALENVVAPPEVDEGAGADNDETTL